MDNQGKLVHNLINAYKGVSVLEAICAVPLFVGLFYVLVSTCF